MENNNHLKQQFESDKIFYKKYLKYKKKYTELKKMSGGGFRNEIVYDGDYIMQKMITDDGKLIGEASRFNFKTKEVKHWYAIQITNGIYNAIANPNAQVKILVLGIALGGILIHLLDKLPNSHVTGVDITSQYNSLVRKYADNTRLELIEADANEFVKTAEPKYDFIVCDIMDGVTLLNFVLSNEFLTNIKNKLNPNGMFLLNTIGISSDKLTNVLNSVFSYANISLTVRPGLPLSNTISVVQLR